MSASTGSASALTRRDAIARCFVRHHVLVDPDGSHYVPRVVSPRTHQIALSFVFTPGEAGLAAIVFVESSASSASAVRERLIKYSIAEGHAPRSQLEPFSETHGASAVGWFAAAHGGAKKIVRACLGPKTSA